MSDHTTRTESYLRFSRRSMIAVFVIGLTLGAFGLAVALHPGGTLARGLGQAAWMIPVAIAIGVAVLVGAQRGHRWDPSSPEAQAILGDEWRQANLDRAARWTLVIVLLSQVPLAAALALFTNLPAPRAVSTMAIATVTIGITSMSGLFLWLDRE